MTDQKQKKSRVRPCRHFTQENNHLQPKNKNEIENYVNRRMLRSY